HLNGTEISPVLPLHLPPQYTAVVKWIHNDVQDDDIREELKMKYKSIYYLESMHGTKSEYTRHVKIEMLNRREYESLLNSGKVNLMGDSYEVNEFLPAPKVLICGRCNRPGYTKKYCQSSAFDTCRRCGGDRTNIQAHKSCIVKCHHCGGEHEATSYKCPLISDFRRELIKQLKNHPERLPPQIQLFIPSDYRNKKDGARTIFSSRQYDGGSYQKSVNQNYYDRNDSQAWPSLVPAITTDTTSV
ncbi:unnamed protein product, partial [Didymodactylos carnosus]